MRLCDGTFLARVTFGSEQCAAEIRAKVVKHLTGVLPVNMTFSIAPLVALIAGVLILVVPRLLNYIVAIYLIVTGLLGLFGTGNLHLH
jgi:hypothetical protein